VEALPSVLPMFSKQLIAYTESTFKESKIEIMTKTMVKEVAFFILAFHFLVLNYFCIADKGKKRRSSTP
jgi:hypothetical protein